MVFVVEMDLTGVDPVNDSILAVWEGGSFFGGTVLVLHNDSSPLLYLFDPLPRHMNLIDLGLSGGFDLELLAHLDQRLLGVLGREV